MLTEAFLGVSGERCDLERDGGAAVLLGAARGCGERLRATSKRVRERHSHSMVAGGFELMS